MEDTKMQQNAVKQIAWVSDEHTWNQHVNVLPAWVSCDWYPDVSSLLKAICDKSYTLICVQSSLIQHAYSQHADISAVIRTMCGISHDRTPHVAIIVDKDTDVSWLRTAASEGYVGVLPNTTWQSVTEFQQAFSHVQEGSLYWPKKIWTWYAHKKPIVVKNTLKLTPRQHQVLHMIQTRGASNKVIAKQLKISESTVKVHIGAIMKKFGVRNRTQLAVSALQQKM
jgi:DNA-binding NarL/FixJ family response regulator